MTNHGLLLGVDLGGSKIEAALLNGQQECVARQRCATPKDGYEQILAAICALCDQVEASIRDAAVTLDAALPIGIGTPGSPSPKSGLMRNCNSTLLNGRAFKEDLERASNREVRMANDADCLALSELADGAAAGSDSLFAVILGTGVGGGVCIGGSLLQGPNGISGEWGHNPLPLDRVASLPKRLKHPRLCYCGRTDCIETWLSGPGLALTHEQLHGQAIDVSALTDSSPDAVHLDTLDVYSRLLATALATVVNLLDPEVIVLGGGLSNIPTLYTALPGLLGQAIFSDVCHTRVSPARHGDSSGVRGAARLWDST